jgi:hypothetical protein
MVTAAKFRAPLYGIIDTIGTVSSHYQAAIFD